MKTVHPSIRRARRWSWASAFFGALLLFTLSAFAGTVQVRDTADLFSPEEEAQLRGAGQQLPFDARVVTSEEHADAAAFDRFVRAQLAGPDMVVVGIDRAHRRTSVHVGKGAGIAASEFRRIEDAGDAYFRRSDWRGGVEAILTQAARASGSAPAGASSAEQPAAQSMKTWLSIGLVVLLVGGLVAAVVISRRRARQAAAGGYGNAPYGQPPQGYGPQPGYGYGGQPGYGPNAYGPGGGGMGGGIGGSLVSAGIGGLVGYGIGRAMSGDGNDSPPHAGADVTGQGSEGYDAGGSTSGWDDGGDAGGGGDFGGGGDGGGSDW